MDRLKTLLKNFMQCVQQFEKKLPKKLKHPHTHTHTHTNILNLHVMINKNVLLLLCTVAKLFLIFGKIYNILNLITQWLVIRKFVD